jgi:hypothetical protein
MDVECLVAYCPSCSVPVGERTRYLERARDQATLHARITGHTVQIADGVNWQAVETVAGEPSLPMWEWPA